jgi:diguanylate cyclase (GGDEF)-like protein
LLFADIDDFRNVNDSLGHEFGDQVLREYAQRISAAVADVCGADALVARYGGDEFLVLAQAEDAMATGELVAKRLVHDLAKPLSLQEHKVYLGTSIGIAIFLEDAADTASLLKDASIAMYQAKIAGKSCYRFYNRAMDSAAARRMHIQQQMHDAWGRGELQLVYQPIYRTADLQLVGVEALLRWQNPELGAIPPSIFIEIAEQSGLIEKIGQEVLLQACKEATFWLGHKSGSNLFVSVNVSSRQLRSSGFVDYVDQCLSDSGLPASQLHLELTETALIGDEMQVETLLERLRRRGIKIWLDDFGTGFSGLNHLRQVPMEGVKIDKSFIAGLQRNAGDLALTKAIIEMAHSQGLYVVAEGVEQTAHYEILRDCGCELLQGFWLGMPLTADQLHLLLADDAGQRLVLPFDAHSGRLPVSP